MLYLYKYRLLYLFLFLVLCATIHAFDTDRCDTFQAQQNNLVQVARRLGQSVPLSPQLIFTPTATVTAVQSENSAQASSLVGKFETFFVYKLF